MGNYFNNIIVLITVASVFAESLKQMKGIDVMAGLLSSMTGASLIAVVAMCGIGIGTALLTGSSNAPWFAFGPMAPAIAAALGCDPGLLLVPMHLTGGMFRCCSPFLGGMIAVSGMAEIDSAKLCKRNILPMAFGSVVCIAASAIVFGL